LIASGPSRNGGKGPREKAGAIGTGKPIGEVAQEGEKRQKSTRKLKIALDSMSYKIYYVN